MMTDKPITTQSETTPSFTRDDILEKLRAGAAQMDPAHAGLYATMSPDRWLAAADLACDLLLEHARYQRRRSGGRRAHSALIHARLDRANHVQLAAALTWVTMAFWLLPAPRQDGE